MIDQLGQLGWFTLTLGGLLIVALAFCAGHWFGYRSARATIYAPSHDEIQRWIHGEFERRFPMPPCKEPRP